MSRQAIIAAVLAAIVAAALLLVASEALGQTTVEFKLLPPGHDGQVKDVGQARYYLLDEYLELAVFDKELVKLRADLQDLGDINAKLELQLKEKDKEIASLDRDKNILARRGMRLEKKLYKCEEEVIELAGGPIWPYIVAIVGGAVGIAGVIYGVTKEDKNRPPEPQN